MKTGKAIVVISFLLIAAVLSGCVQQPDDEEQNQGSSFVPENSEDEKTDFEKLEELVSREKHFEDSRRPAREDYGIPSEVFEDLPPVPDDFGTMTYLFEIGKWRDINYFKESYYLQPEFYPLFDESGLRWWTNPEPESWGVVGWGAYPGDVFVETHPGAEFTAKTFWHVGWGVQTYQGFQLMPVYPSSSQDENEHVINRQDPTVVKDYFSVSFEEPVFLMAPTYPKFEKDWARVVEMNVKVKEGTPAGKYVLGIGVGTPPEEQRSYWLAKHKTMYFDAVSGSLSIGRPHFRLIVNVS